MKMHREFEILCEACQEAARRLVAENPNATDDEFIELAIYESQAWEYDTWEDNENAASGKLRRRMPLRSQKSAAFSRSK